MKNALYLGEIEHRRFVPTRHNFSYGVCYYFLNLDDLKKIFRFPFLFSYNSPGLLSFWRKDYLGRPHQDLKTCVQEVIKEKTQEDFKGSVYLFANLSYFGFCFNPVSFYFCYNDQDELEFIVAEITNTPWGERHQEVLSAKGSNKIVRRFEKSFHVSPFMQMEIDYTWVFSTPDENLTVLMQNRKTGERKILFDSTLNVKRYPLCPLTIVRSFFRFPFVTLKTMLAIYWQALLLYFKKVPFYPHPVKEKRL